MTTTEMTSRRQLLESDDWNTFGALRTDQQRGVPPPPIEKPAPEGAPLFDLVSPAQFTVGTMPLADVIRKRRSRRTFAKSGLTLEELSFLLWSCQGIEKVVSEIRAFRTVPSAGCRHPFETYVLVNRVDGLTPGLYRYLPLENRLCLVNADPGVAEKIHAGSRDQYVLESAATFIWTVIPYRTEWRYLHHSHRVILMDVGHVCQNLYLAAEAIGCGTCALAAYDQGLMDAALGVDGEEEFTVYMAPVGRIG